MIGAGASTLLKEPEVPAKIPVTDLTELYKPFGVQSSFPGR